MGKKERQYSSEEVSGLVRRALEIQGGSDTVGYEDLKDIALQSGVSVESLDRAMDEEARYGDLERAKAEWVKRRRVKFFAHLRSYLIVNAVLFVINLITGPGYLWVMWPMLGWGIGLAFDASDTFFTNSDKIERGAQRLIRKRRRRHMAEALDDF